MNTPDESVFCDKKFTFDELSKAFMEWYGPNMEHHDYWPEKQNVEGWISELEIWLRKMNR